MDRVTVIGGGLAGCEAAWQLARRGVPVRLYEMRPDRTTGAHRTGRLAELVCSNSFKSDFPNTASGELKREMRVMGSVVMDAAAEAAIPAGEALAVDRELFARGVEERLAALGNLEIVRQEAPSIPDEGIVIIATGPLTSDALAQDISRVTGTERLHFYDAVSPVVETDSLDFENCFRGSRYGKGEGDYINCPMTEKTYHHIWQEILDSDKATLHDFEDPKFFEGCLPLEEIARTGRETLAHGPWKPVGLIDPRTNRRPYAVLQLRPETADGTCYSMVACQTRMKWPEQRRIFRMIPALANAEFLRLGVVHRNTYLDSPRLLDETLQLKTRPGLFFAGQIVGVEGYLESAAAGMLAGINAWVLNEGGSALFVPPPESMLGALIRHVSASPSPEFAPMNANFGILPPMEGVKRRKDEKRLRLCERALAAFEQSATPYLPSPASSPTASPLS